MLILKGAVAMSKRFKFVNEVCDDFREWQFVLHEDFVFGDVLLNKATSPALAQSFHVFGVFGWEYE